MERDITLLGYMMDRCVCAISAALAANFKKEGIDLSFSQYVAIRALYANGQASQVELATWLRKDTAAIKRTIDKLVRKGFVIRCPVSGRQNNLHLTAKGRDLHGQIMKSVLRTMQTLLAGIPGTTQEEVFGFLDHIYHQAKGIDK